ncbi:MAG: tetratricopeptide repeat protein [Bacteroidales bacterium]|nr:MAG: tetratricopeptide repeat protein [Bacteroidales bacterium]
MKKECLGMNFLKSNICIVFLLININVFAQESNNINIDSMILNAKSILYSSPDKAFEMAKSAIDLSVKQKNSLMLANGHRLLGSYYSDIKGDFNAAMISYRIADSIYRSNDGKDYTEGIGAIYHCYGVIDQRLGNYFESIQNYLKALNILDSIKNKTIIPKTLNNISILYAFLKDYKKAEEYSRECLKICEENKDEYMISVVNVGLADALISQGKFDEVPELLNTSMKIATKLNNLYILELCHLNFGSYYYLFDKNYKKSIEEYRIAMQYAEKLGSEWEVMRLSTNLSEVYMLDHQYKNARLSAEKAIAIASRMGSSDVKQRALYVLAKVNAVNGSYVNAYNNLLKSYILKDTVFAESKQMHINYLESLYQSEKKEKEIVILKNRQKDNEVTLKKRKYQVIALGVFVSVIIIVVVFVIIWIKDKQTINNQKLHIQEQQIRKLEQEKQLIATKSLLEGETTERARLSKDLHDGLGGLLSVTKHKMANMKGSLTIPEEQVETFNSALEMLDNSIKELRRVAHNLMPESLMRYGLNSAISDFCNSIDKANYHFYGTDKRLDEKLEVAAFRIVSELVNNALKHADASKINVQLVQEQDRISLTIYDDGCGFDPKAIDRTKSGGLNNIESRVISFNGRIDILSEPGKGTEVSVEFKC